MRGNLHETKQNILYKCFLIVEFQQHWHCKLLSFARTEEQEEGEKTLPSFTIYMQRSHHLPGIAAKFCHLNTIHLS